MKIEERDWLIELEPIVRQAGAILLSYFGKSLDEIEKENNSFATQADLQAEAMLMEQLSQLLPQASFFAEESGQKGDTNGYCWVIDPLDGTTNFARGIPYFCISIALTYKNSPICGLIYQPLTDELFFAQKEKGAFLNGNPIQVGQYVQKNVVSIGFPYQESKRDQLINLTQGILPNVFAIRYFGAIALDLAYLACGRIDGVVFAYLEWWDVAAGMIILEQAGGVITDFTGKSLDPDYTSCVAGSPSMYARLIELIKKA